MNAIANFDPRYESNVAQLRIPPQSIEGECSLLGGLMLDNSAWDQVGDLLTDSDFYRRDHQFIFSAIGRLINACKPADIMTVYAELQSRDEADDVGGMAYLNSLSQYVPSAANIRRYAEIVRERAILRKLVSVGDQIAQAGFASKGQPIADVLDECEQKLLAIGEAGARKGTGFQSMDKLVVQVLDRVSELAGDTDKPAQARLVGFLAQVQSHRFLAAVDPHTGRLAPADDLIRKKPVSAERQQSTH